MRNLNLYQVQRRRQGGPRPRQMLLVVLVAALLVAAHLGWQLWQVQGLKARLADAERAAAAEEALLADERARFRPQEADPLLPKQLAGAQLRNQQLQRLVEHLRLLAAQHQKGFAEALDALAEQHPTQGLWLTGILLEDGGRELRLEGRSQDQQQLPAYLQALGRAPAFAGREFAHFSAQREAQQPFAFVLSSRPAEEVRP